MSESETQPIIQKRLYMNDTYLFEAFGIVKGLRTLPHDDSYFQVLFDEIIFHPQGGGQPSDTGSIVLTTGEDIPVMNVQKDMSNDNIWLGLPISKKDKIQYGDKLVQRIDENLRRTYAKYHSAGHWIDVMVKKLGLTLTPGRGNHSPGDAWVEYIGNLPKETWDKTLEDLRSMTVTMTEATKDDDKTQVIIYRYDEASKKFTLPAIVSKDSPIRCIKLIQEDEGCLCGGTHVSHIRECGEVIYQKWAKKGKNLRLYYDINPTGISSKSE